MANPLDALYSQTHGAPPSNPLDALYAQTHGAEDKPGPFRRFLQGAGIPTSGDEVAALARHLDPLQGGIDDVRAGRYGAAAARIAGPVGTAVSDLLHVVGSEGGEQAGQAIDSAQATAQKLREGDTAAAGAAAKGYVRHSLGAAVPLVGPPAAEGNMAGAAGRLTSIVAPEVVRVVVPRVLNASAVRSMSEALPAEDAALNAKVAPQLVDKRVSFATPEELVANTKAAIAPSPSPTTGRPMVSAPDMRLASDVQQLAYAMPEGTRPVRSIAATGAKTIGGMALKSGIGAGAGALLGQGYGRIGEMIGAGIGGLHELRQIPGAAWDTLSEIRSSPSWNSISATAKARAAALLASGDFEGATRTLMLGQQEVDSMAPGQRYLGEIMQGYRATQQPVRPVETQQQQQGNAGHIKRGNIDLNTRPVVTRPDGQISTVLSMGIEVDGKEVLIPRVSDDGRIMSEQEAVEQFRRSGRHLGVFDSVSSANAYAKQLHEQQATLYGGAQQRPVQLEWPRDPNALDENDAMFMRRRNDKTGASLRWPDVKVLPSQVLPERFANARKLSWGAPTTSANIPVPGGEAGGLTGLAFEPSDRRAQLSEIQRPGFDPSQPEADSFRRPTAIIAGSQADKPHTYAHELNHTIWFKDLSDDEKQRFRVMVVEAVNKVRNASGNGDIFEKAAAVGVPRAVVAYAKMEKAPENIFRESFAELGAQYIMNPMAFRSAYPEWYNAIKAIYGGREYIGGKITDAPRR